MFDLTNMMQRLQTMGKVGYLGIVYLFLMTVSAQDTLLRDSHNTYKPVKYGSPGVTTSSTGGWQTELTRLQERMDHRLRETERRILRRLHEKLHVQNQSQGSTNKDLQKMVEHLSQHLEDLRDMTNAKDDVIERLKQQVTHQQRELHKNKNSLDRLQKTVTNLSELVEELLMQRQVTSSPSPVTSQGSTTPVPFNPMFPVDCEDVYLNGGMKYPGYYYIMIHPYLAKNPFKVCCRMTNHSGWTLIQRREDGSLDFYKTWDEYKKGFGSLEGEFWLGLDHMYQLTNQGDYRLRVEMKDWDNKTYWAEYDHFRVSSESDKYRLHVHGYHGNAGDSLTSPWNSHDTMMFSTKDSDNDNRFYDNCADHYHGAWWFKSCFESHLNGVYYHKGAHNNYFVRNGVQWNTIHTHSSLKHVAMMIKPTKDVHDETTDYINGVD